MTRMLPYVVVGLSATPIGLGFYYLATRMVAITSPLLHWIVAFCCAFLAVALVMSIGIGIAVLFARRKKKAVALEQLQLKANAIYDEITSTFEDDLYPTPHTFPSNFPIGVKHPPNLWKDDEPPKGET